MAVRKFIRDGIIFSVSYIILSLVSYYIGISDAHTQPKGDLQAGEMVDTMKVISIPYIFSFIFMFVNIPASLVLNYLYFITIPPFDVGNINKPSELVIVNVFGLFFYFTFAFLLMFIISKLKKRKFTNVKE